MLRRPYNVETLIDDYGRLGEARRIAPPSDGGDNGRCPRADVTAYFDVAAFLAANPMGGTVKVESATE